MISRLGALWLPAVLIFFTLVLGLFAVAVLGVQPEWRGRDGTSRSWSPSACLGPRLWTASLAAYGTMGGQLLPDLHGAGDARLVHQHRSRRYAPAHGYRFVTADFGHLAALAGALSLAILLPTEVVVPRPTAKRASGKEAVRGTPLSA